jgi:hypothetical protein
VPDKAVSRHPADNSATDKLQTDTSMSATGENSADADNRCVFIGLLTLPLSHQRQVEAARRYSLRTEASREIGHASIAGSARSSKDAF